MKDQRPDKQVESLITGDGDACSTRSQFHKAAVYIIAEGSAVPAGLRATQIKCTSCKIQRDPRARARANGSEPLSFFKNFHAPYLPPSTPPTPPLPSPARHETRGRPIDEARHSPLTRRIRARVVDRIVEKSESERVRLPRSLGKLQRKSDKEEIIFITSFQS